MFNRIQKLLSAEYSSFYEHVLVESPFAQLSKRMRGIRAVQIALTEKNLIVASDTFYTRDEGLLTTGRVDADIETLKLTQIIPLKFIHIKLFRKGLHDKFYMKVIFKKNLQQVWRVYEFGGHFLKHFFWSEWNERLTKMKERE